MTRRMIHQRMIYAPALVLATLLILSGGSLALSEEPNGEAITEANFPTFAKNEAKSYTIRRAEGANALNLREEPVLAWTNPVSGTVHGRLFIWTDKGRPEAVVGIYKWFSPFTHRTDEFQSLSLGPLTAERDGRPSWTPNRAGVVLKAVPDATIPAASPAQRLRQMRDLAKDFTVRQTTRANLNRDLRVLPQPLYRYESNDPNLTDGALFGITLGTDPEAVLLLEARRVGQDLQWQFALARMNSIQMRASYRGVEVWAVETLPWSVVDDRSQPYTTFKVGLINP